MVTFRDTESAEIFLKNPLTNIKQCCIMDKVNKAERS